MPSGYYFYIGTIVIAIINLLKLLCALIIHYPRDFITFTAWGQLILLAGKTFWTELYKKNFPLDGQARRAKSMHNWEICLVPCR